MGTGTNTVILGVDGTDPRTLVDWYISNFHHHGDKLVVVHSHDSKEEDKWIMLASGRAAMSSTDRHKNSLFREARCCKIHNQCQKILDKRMVNCKFHSREGRFEDAVVSAAREEKANLVVMPDHCYSRIWRVLLGNSLEYVKRHTGLPVLAFSTKKTITS